jgi:hypothetical protein
MTKECHSVLESDSQTFKPKVVGSIPTAPTNISLILLPFHTCTSQNNLKTP